MSSSIFNSASSPSYRQHRRDIALSELPHLGHTNDGIANCGTRLIKVNESNGAASSRHWIIDEIMSSLVDHVSFVCDVDEDFHEEYALDEITHTLIKDAIIEAFSDIESESHHKAPHVNPSDSNPHQLQQQLNHQTHWPVHHIQAPMFTTYLANSLESIPEECPCEWIPGASTPREPSREISITASSSSSPLSFAALLSITTSGLRGSSRCLDSVASVLEATMELVQHPTHLLKLRRSRFHLGKPTEKSVYLSTARQTIVWQDIVRYTRFTFKLPKRGRKREIGFSSVRSLCMGKSTEAFRCRSLNHLDNRCCFSFVLYNGKTLDFVADSMGQRDAFIQGVQYVFALLGIPLQQTHCDTATK